MMAILDRILGPRQSHLDDGGPVTITDDGAGNAFAAQTIGLKNRGIATTRNYHASQEARLLWDAYDQIGELRNAVAKLARIAGHSQIRVMKIGEDGRPTPNFKRSEMPRQAAMVDAALLSPEGGQRGMLERYYELIKVAAFMEVETVRTGDRAAVGELVAVRFRSSEEIIRDGKTVKLRRVPNAIRGWNEPPVEAVKDYQPSRLIGQMWVPHPRFTDMPVSSFWAMRSTIDQTIALQNSITQRLQSRLVMAGMHMFPSGLTDVHLPASAPEKMKGASALAKIAWIMQQAYQTNDPNDLSQIVGILMQGEKEDIEAYRWVDNARELIQGDLELMAQLIDRLVTGMDAQRGSVIGRQDSNHFSSWADDSDELRSNVIPELDRLAYGLTNTVLWPFMRKPGSELGMKESVTPVPAKEVGQWVVGYEADGVTTQVNRVENMRQANDAGAVGDAAYAKSMGIRQDELIDDENYVRHVGKKTGNPYLATYGLPIHKQIDWDKVAAVGSTSGPSKTDPGRAKSAPGVGEPGSPADQRGDGKPVS